MYFFILALFISLIEATATPPDEVDDVSSLAYGVRCVELGLSTTDVKIASPDEEVQAFIMMQKEE